MNNCATKHDANFKIPCFTDYIDDGNKNAFLLYIGNNTNMSSYLHDLYEYDETENENEMKIWSPRFTNAHKYEIWKYENESPKWKWNEYKIYKWILEY